MDWIKLEVATINKPEISRMSAMLKKPKLEVFGACLAFWAWLDGLTLDGKTDLKKFEIDFHVGLDGFEEAMIKVNWLVRKRGGYVVPNFDNHMTKSAKQRAMEQKKKAKQRANLSRKEGDTCPDDVPQGGGHERDGEEREEKRREEGDSLSVSHETGEGGEREESFQIWLKNFEGTHPECQDCRLLSLDATKKARLVFDGGLSITEDEKRLLGLFYAKELKDEDIKRKVWRPDSFKGFIANLRTTITNAKKWASFWGVQWKKKKPSKPTQKQETIPAEKNEENDTLPADEAIAFLRGCAGGEISITAK